LRKITVGHLASFHGNVGDQFNHLSFRPWLQKQTSDQLVWKEFEIRDSYRGDRLLKPDFIEFAKSKDLIVIGGGNFFELWPENSVNGTSINLSTYDIQSIGKPVFFNSLGVDAGQGISGRARDYFKSFFESLTNNPKYFVSLRNDGSLEQLNDMGVESLNLSVLPDAGFFYSRNHQNYKENIIVGINIAEDMSNLRYGVDNGEVFLQSLTKAIINLSNWNNKIQFRFFPHIYSDLAFISRLLKLLPDKIVRTDITVEKYSTREEDAIKLSIAYGECELVVATRFHANALPLGLGVPTIGLNTYPQIQKTFREIGLLDQCVSPNDGDFESKLEFLMRDALVRNSDWQSKQEQIKNKLVKDREEVGAQLSSWMSRNIAR